MKEVKAIVQPFMLNHVLDALHRIEGTSDAIQTHAHTGKRGDGSKA